MFTDYTIGNKPQEDDDDDNLTLSLVSKQIAIHRLPPVLILHMKRFKIEPDSISKDTQHIEFPLKLNMAPYCTTECIKVLINIFFTNCVCASVFQYVFYRTM